VQLGPAGTDDYPVLAGLKEGERIVSQGSFLIDSQTRITDGMTGMFGGSKEFDHGQADQGQAQAPAVPQIKFTFRITSSLKTGGTDLPLTSESFDTRAEADPYFTKSPAAEWRSQSLYKKPEDFVFPSEETAHSKPLDLASVLSKKIQPAFRRI